MKKILLLVALACATFIVSNVGAQESVAPVSPAAPSEATNREDTPEYRAFADEMVKYKTALKKLRSLKEAYQTASATEKDQIVAEFTPLVEATTQQQKQIVPLAIKAYRSINGQNVELRAFLCAMLQWSVQDRENYEVAYEIAKAVFEYDLPAENGDLLYGYAAFAAFCTMNLDDAENWYKVAKEKGVVSKCDPSETMHLQYNLEYVLPKYKDLWNQEQKIREQEAAADNLPRVLLRTTKGDITLELFKNEAPIAVNNFLSLVKSGFYTDVPFHRVLPFFMAQGGDPTGTGSGGPGYCIKCECYQDNARMHFRGVIAMAHAGINTGGSQFFLDFVPCEFLNKKHTVFGRIIDGMDVLSDIQRIDPEKESDAAPDKILEAKILRGEPEEFEKLPGR
ncbi:MAG: peptidylprolyl isomerase [Thermoguttaceae bacterium]|nr:peptidylprolyl isomerase [Thermoguttaceae bacterium]